MPILVNTDGGVRTSAGNGSRGPASWAATFQTPTKGRYELSGFIEDGTVNEAEYTALIEAFQSLSRSHITTGVIIRSDSELCVKQLKGEYMVRQPSLLPFWTLAFGLLEQLRAGGIDIQLVHIPREENAAADAICNKVLAEHGYPKKSG